MSKFAAVNENIALLFTKDDLEGYIFKVQEFCRKKFKDDPELSIIKSCHIDLDSDFDMMIPVMRGIFKDRSQSEGYKILKEVQVALRKINKIVKYKNFGVCANHMGAFKGRTILITITTNESNKDLYGV